MFEPAFAGFIYIIFGKGENEMSLPIKHSLVHHLALTVTDMDRSLAFYTKLGFEKVAEFREITLSRNFI